jgi:hypothetical protein
LSKGFLALLASVVAIALVAAGCGSSSDTTEESTSEATLTKSEFLKQGNAICAAGNKEIEEGFEEFGKENNLSENKAPTEAQFEEISETVLVPGVSKQLEGLRSLGTPEGDEGELDELLSNAEGELEEVEEDPSVLSKEDPFAEVNKEARAYGLTVCGEENEEEG